MRIKVNIFASLRRYIADSIELIHKDGFEVSEGTTVGEVIDMLSFPKSLQILTMVNGVQSNAKERALEDGVSILLYPFMAGG